jgi:cyclic pyranopterin phosphate synthase
MSFSDSFGRVVRKLRVSVTDRCNFRCLYCLPEEPRWVPRSQILSFEEIERVVGVMLANGVHKVRLTGGEPLVRRDVTKLVAHLARLHGLSVLSMTTNGFYLAEHAAELKAAGLDAVTVSLDSLNPEQFRELVRRDALVKVMEGIEAALAAGFSPIKLNVVPMRGVNEQAIDDFARLARSGPYIVRFIEYMPLDSGGKWSTEKVVSAAEIIERLSAIAPLELVRDQDPHQPSRRYRFADGRGEIGLIASVTQPFCDRCDRIRLTADGKILNCLFSHDEFDLRGPLRNGASDQQLADLIAGAVARKKEGHVINQPGFVPPPRPMVSLGG